ncbi:ABC transporter C family member 3-like protein [Tanacetum coccineum]
MDMTTHRKLIDEEIEATMMPEDYRQKKIIQHKDDCKKRKYWKYITTTYGGALVPFIVLEQIAFQVLQIRSTYWMAWASPVLATDPAPVTGTTLIIVYVALAVRCALCILGRGLLLSKVAYKSATLLFHKMNLSIFRSPMSFFDSTPSG